MERGSDSYVRKQCSEGEIPQRIQEGSIFKRKTMISLGLLETSLKVIIRNNSAIRLRIFDSDFEVSDQE